MLPILLSFGAVYALIPLLIIIILIAAAAGLSRGYDIFAIFGIGVLAGIGGSQRGRGTLAGKSAFKAHIGGTAAGIVARSYGGKKIVGSAKEGGIVAGAMTRGKVAYQTNRTDTKYAQKYHAEATANFQAGSPPPLNAPKTEPGRTKRAVNMAIKVGKKVGKAALLGSIGSAAVFGGPLAAHTSKWIKGRGKEERFEGAKAEAAGEAGNVAKNIQELTAKIGKKGKLTSDKQAAIATAVVSNAIKAPTHRFDTGGKLYEAVKQERLGNEFNSIRNAAIVRDAGGKAVRVKSVEEIKQELDAVHKEFNLSKGRFETGAIQQAALDKMSISSLKLSLTPEQMKSYIELDAYRRSVEPIVPGHQKLDRIMRTLVKKET